MLLLKWLYSTGTMSRLAAVECRNKMSNEGTIFRPEDLYSLSVSKINRDYKFLHGLYTKRQCYWSIRGRKTVRKDKSGSPGFQPSLCLWLAVWSKLSYLNSWSPHMKMWVRVTEKTQRFPKWWCKAIWCLQYEWNVLKRCSHCNLSNLEIHCIHQGST